MKTSSRVLACVLILLAAQSAFAKTTTFNVGSGAFENAGSWNNGVPVAGDTVIINSGTCTLSTSVTILDFQFGGGTLTFSSGALTVTGTMTWTAGTLNGTGVLTLDVGSTLTMSGAGGKTIDTCTVNLMETGTYGGAGQLTIQTGAQFNIPSGATFNITSDTQIGTGGAGPAINISSGGLMEKNGGLATTTIQVPINNNGTVRTTTLGLVINGLNGVHSGVFDAQSGTTITFSNSQTFSTGADFTGTGTIAVTGNTQTINANCDAVNFDFSNGTITGTGTLTITGTSNWSGGQMTGAGATVVGTSCTMTLSGASAKTLDGRTLTVNGTVNFSGPASFVMNNSANLNISSTGLFDIKIDQDITIGGSVSTINNSGIFRKSAGVTSSTINAQLSNNAGGQVQAQVATLNFNRGGLSTSSTFDVSSGATLAFTSQTFIINPSTTFTGAGTYSLTGGTLTANANAGMPNFTMSGGTQDGTANLTVSNLMTWTGGLLAGSGKTIIGASATLNFTGGNAKSMDVRTLEIAGTGTANLGGTGDFNTSNSSVISILSGGFFNITSDVNIVYSAGTTPSIAVAGTLRKTGGVATSQIGIVVNNNGTVAAQTGTLALARGGTQTGAFSASSGATMSFTSQTCTISTGTTFSGAGTFSLTGGTFTVMANTTIPNFSISGGTQDGTANLTISMLMTWTGGQMIGSGKTIIGAAATLNFTGGTAKTIDVRTLEIAGIANFGGTGDFNHSNSSVLSILAGGIFNITTDVNIVFSAGTTPSVNNAGTLSKTGGTLTSQIGIPVNNTGTVDAQSGTLSLARGGVSTGAFNSDTMLQFAGSGTHTINSGATFTGAGTFSQAGGNTISFNGDVTIPNLAVSGGTLNGTGVVSVSNSFIWSGGQMTGSGATTINAGATLDFTTATAKSLDVRTLNIAGTATVMSTGSFQLSTGATVNVLSGGILDFQSDASVTFAFGTTPSMNNAGTIQKSAGTTTSIDAIFTNTGSLDSMSGVISFARGFTQTAGTTFLSGGNVTSTMGFTFTGGFVHGAGTLTGNVNNTGATLQPGGSTVAGTLTITGTYTQGASGAINIELGGTSGGQFDVVSISGAATLNGSLNVSLINSFTPANGNTFTCVTFPSRSGFFTSNNTTGTGVNPVFGGVSVTLVFGAAGPLAKIVSPLSVTAVKDAAFTYTIVAIGQPAITYNATGLPPGLTFSVDTISGIPTAIGTTPVTITAMNSLNTDTQTLIIDVPIAGTAPVVTSPLAAPAIVDVPFLYSVSATGTQPITFSVANLPPGLSFNGNTISGTPTAIGATSITLTASNLLGTDSKTLTLTVGAGAGVATAMAVPNPALINTDVVFTADLGAVPDPLATFTWTFGDGTPTSATNPATHRYTTVGSFNVDVVINSGGKLQQVTLTVSTLAPNTGADGVLNISDGKAAVSNPDNGLTSRVAASNGGVVEVAIDPTAITASRAVDDDFDIVTGFDTISGRVAQRNGSRAVNKFPDPGVFVAETDVTRRATGGKTKVRKTVVINGRETGQSGALPAPASTDIVLSSIKGKFLFTKATPDQVSFSGKVTLPAGFSTTAEQSISLGIGNVIDSATVSVKGKGVLPSALSRIKKLQVKYPKLTGPATGTEVASISVTLSLPDMDAAGFDTEGVSSKSVGGSGARSIQTAIVLGGVSYEAVLPVQFKLSTKGDSGQISGRGAKP